MDDLGVGVGELAGGRLDRVDVAQQVGDRDVRGGQLLVVARLARQPLDRRLVAGLGHQPLPPGRDRIERIVIQLAAGQAGDLVVQELDQRAQDAGLGLAAQAEQDEVVPGQQRVDDAGDDGALVAQDLRKELLSGRQPAAQVGAHLLFYRARTVAGGLQRSEGLGASAHQSCASSQRSASIAALQPVPAAVTAWR